MTLGEIAACSWSRRGSTTAGSRRRRAAPPSSFEPVTDATTWTFNEVSRSMRVPVQSLRAADVGPTASTLEELNKETLYHGTRAGVLCLQFFEMAYAHCRKPTR